MSLGVKKEIFRSTEYALKQASDKVDDIFMITKKLLEKPYSNKELYRILDKEYHVDEPPANGNDKEADTKKVLEILYNDILYYYNFISAVTIVPTNREESYFKYSFPTTLNVFGEWKNLKETNWYKECVQQDKPIIYGAHKDTIYKNEESEIVSFMQRIEDPFKQKLLGVMRIDIRVSSLVEIVESLVNDTEDILLVVDDNNRPIYISNDEFEEYKNQDFSNPHKIKVNNYINTSYTSEISSYKYIYLTSENKFKSKFYVMLITYLSVILFYVFIAIFLIVYTTKLISIPILKLKSAMRKAEQGDLNVRSEKFKGEVGELGDAFNSLMDKTNCLIEDIKISEAEKTKLSYEVLESKINPHFLYNTLNAVKWKANIIGAKDISNTLDSLVHLMKFTIKIKNEVIPLESELEQLEHYIKIMRIRYGDDIEINFDIDEESLKYKTIKFTIQPILENCYIHAFNNEKEFKYINVSINVDSNNLVYEVYDNGDGVTEEQIEKILNSEIDNKENKFISIGINNVNARIKARFGDEYGISIESELGKYTKVRVVIPKVTSGGKNYEDSFSR